MATPEMSAALSRLWTRFLPEIEERVAQLEAAAKALAAADLSREQRDAAHATAHKLAGSLGMFGLHRGTELARQAELAFAQESVASTEEISTWIAEIQMLVQSR